MTLTVTRNARWRFWLVTVGPLTAEVSDADLFFDGGAIYGAVAELTERLLESKGASK